MSEDHRTWTADFFLIDKTKKNYSRNRDLIIIKMYICRKKKVIRLNSIDKRNKVKVRNTLATI